MTAGREQSAFGEPLDRLSSTPAGRENAIVLVEDDDELTAFLHELPPSLALGSQRGEIRIVVGLPAQQTHH